MSKISAHHQQLSLQYKTYKAAGGELSWNEFQRQSSPSKTDIQYVQLLEHIKSHSMKNRKSLESTYNKLKDLLDTYTAEAQSAYSTFVISDYNDSTAEAHYKMCKLRVAKLNKLLNIIFTTYLQYDQMQTDKNSYVDKSMMEGVGRYYIGNDEDDEETY